MAVLGWLGMAATEESTWRQVKLRGAAAEGCCGPPAARGAVRAIPSANDSASDNTDDNEPPI